MGVRAGNAFEDVRCRLQFNLRALAEIASILNAILHTQAIDKQENAV